MIEKVVAVLAIKKGLWIGFFAGILKVMTCINAGKFKPIKAVINIISATIMGYMMWELAMLIQVSLFVAVVATVISSFNAFLTIEAVQDPKIFKLILKKYLNK